MSADEAFDSVLSHLRDTSQPVSMSVLYHLSDLSRQDRDELETLWPELDTERRQAIVQNLHEIAEANFEVSFDAVFRLALEDESPEVRATSIRALWESEEPDLIAPFLNFLQNDSDPLVRAAAASALGRYIYLGEIEELPAAQSQRVEKALLAVIHGSDELEVRRRALEALAFSSRPEVHELVRTAYDSDEAKMRVSAVFAMGRTANADWAKPVRAELDSPEPEMRFEAARAAGELELQDAGPRLAELTSDADQQVREAAIWSLGQIGGEFARETLTQLLEQAEDDDSQEFIQEALENLDFTDEMQAFSMFEFEPGEEDTLELDLEDEEVEDEDLEADDLDADSGDEEDEAE